MKNEEMKMELTSSYDTRLATTDINELLADYSDMEFKLDRAKIPSGGGLMFELPGEEDEAEQIKELVGVIVYQHPVNGYYKTAYKGGNNPPDCCSFDGINGAGDPGGNCKSCPMNQYGSASEGDGKACKNRRWLYLLRENELLPIMISVPTASLQSFSQYMKHLLCKGVKYSQVVTRLSLRKAVSKGGITYSQVTFKQVRPLSADECTAISNMSGQIMSLVKMTANAENLAEETALTVDSATGEVIPPLV